MPFLQVLFAFMVGLHNLYWYYGAQKIKMCINGHTVYVHAAEAFQGYVCLQDFQVVTTTMMMMRMMMIMMMMLMNFIEALKNNVFLSMY